jgi:Transposase, Mutator family
VLNYLPKSVQPKAKADLHAIYEAASRADAEAAFDRFLAKYEAKYDKAAGCLVKDRTALLAFYDFPAEHWKHVRSTNPVESTFATVRLRTDKTKGCLSRATALALVFKLARSAERHWRRLNHALIRAPREDRLHDIGRKQGQPQDPAHVALRDVLGVADLADRGMDALIKHPLPPPRARECFDQRAVGQGFGCRRDRAAVRCYYALPAPAALEPHRDADDQRRPIEPGLSAFRHAAFLAPLCRNSPTRLAKPSALIRTSSAASCTFDPVGEQLEDARPLGEEQLVPNCGELGEQVRDFTGAPSSLVVWYRANL